MQEALKAYAASAEQEAGVVPQGQRNGGKTEALPAIWTNKADFDGSFAKFGEDSKAALAAIKDETSSRPLSAGAEKLRGLPRDLPRQG